MLADGAADRHHGKSSPHIGMTVEGINRPKKAQRRFDAASASGSDSQTVGRQMYTGDNPNIFYVQRLRFSVQRRI
jgi:hypothetical protein